MSHALVVVRNDDRAFSRMVMAATEHLYATHERIKNRTRQLEDAIRELQSRLSPSTPHPLLLKLASPNELDDYSPPRSLLSFPIKPSSAPIIAGLTGTLSVDKNGSSRFLGPGGAYEVILLLISLLTLLTSDFLLSLQSFLSVRLTSSCSLAQILT